jgi:hypothetical protein
MAEQQVLWKPVLTGELAAEAVLVARDVARRLKRRNAASYVPAAMPHIRVSSLRGEKNQPNVFRR